MGRTKYEAPTMGKSHTIMTNDEREKGKKSHWDELVITGNVKTISLTLFTYTHLRVLYLQDNQLERIPVEIAQLTKLQYLNLNNNKISSIPEEMCDMIELRFLSLKNNKLNSIPHGIGKLFQLQTLHLEGNAGISPDVVSAAKSGLSGFLQYMLDRQSFTATHPPQRPWVTLQNPQRNVSTALFTVMNYNVLSDTYCNRQVYGYCPSWALHWDYRKKGILEEIRHYSADIICLQEVESKQYTDFFSAELQKDGYKGKHFCKGRVLIAATNVEAERVDGCAIFWRDNKFKLTEEKMIDFRKIALGSSKLCVENMINRVQTKDNIGVCLLLETKEAAWDVNSLPKQEYIKKHILVTNTHITWDPEYSDVKLIQTIMLMNEVNSFVEEHLGTGQKPPLILCGDFNSLPESGVCDFLSKGKVAASHEEFQGCDYSKVLEYFSSGSKLDKQATHPYKLQSAYKMEHMPFTNHTYDFKGVIDYVYHNKHLKALGVLGQLDSNWFADNRVVGCPHPHVHSDHLSLLVEFEMTAGDKSYI